MAADTLIHLSEIKKYGNLAFLARQAVEGFITGMHRSPYHGFSVEFAEHRLYNTGESTRHIDWKVMAKTDKLFVKQYQEETNLRCRILLDISASMYYPVHDNGKIVFSAWASAALAYLMMQQRDAVGLSAFHSDIVLNTRARNTQSHVMGLIATLQQLMNAKPQQGKTSSISEAIHSIAETEHKRSLIVIFTDTLDSSADAEKFFTALQHLKHRKHEVIVFNVSEGGAEWELDLDDRPYLFVDAETGATVKLNPAGLKEAYQEKMMTYRQELKLRCMRYKIDYVEADIRKGLNQILVTYLTKRGIF